LVTKQGEVNEIIDEGNQIIDDDSIPEGERKQVHEKMIALHDDWNKLANLTSGKQQRLVGRDMELYRENVLTTSNCIFLAEECTTICFKCNAYLCDLTIHILLCSYEE